MRPVALPKDLDHSSGDHLGDVGRQDNEHSVIYGRASISPRAHGLRVDQCLPTTATPSRARSGGTLG